MKLKNERLTESFGDFRVVHLWIVLCNFATLESGPDHESVHRSLDVIWKSNWAFAVDWRHAVMVDLMIELLLLLLLLLLLVLVLHHLLVIMMGHGHVEAGSVLHD